MLESFFRSMASAFGAMFEWLIESFLKTMTFDSGDILEMFPFFRTGYNILRGISFGLLFALAITGIIRAVVSPLTASTESPLRIIFRTMLATVMIYYGGYVLSYLIELAKIPFSLMLGSDAASLSDAGNELSWDGASLLDSIGFALADAGGALLGGEILEFVLILLIGYNLFRLILEIVERYLIIFCLLFTSPLVYPVMATDASAPILKKWFSMFIGQCVIMTLSAWILQMVLAGFAAIGSFGEGGLFAFCCLFALCQIGLRTDNYLQQLGLGNAITGGGLAMSMLVPLSAMLRGGRRLADSHSRGDGVLGRTPETHPAETGRSGSMEGRPVGQPVSAGTEQSAGVSVGGVAFHTRTDKEGKPFTAWTLDENAKKNGIGTKMRENPNERAQVFSGEKQKVADFMAQNYGYGMQQKSVLAVARNTLDPKKSGEDYSAEVRNALFNGSFDSKKNPEPNDKLGNAMIQTAMGSDPAIQGREFKNISGGKDEIMGSSVTAETSYLDEKGQEKPGIIHFTDSYGFENASEETRKHMKPVEGTNQSAYYYETDKNGREYVEHHPEMAGKAAVSALTSQAAANSETDIPALRENPVQMVSPGLDRTRNGPETVYHPEGIQADDKEQDPEPAAVGRDMEFKRNEHEFPESGFRPTEESGIPQSTLVFETAAGEERTPDGTGFDFQNDGGKPVSEIPVPAREEIVPGGHAGMPGYHPPEDRENAGLPAGPEAGSNLTQTREFPAAQMEFESAGTEFKVKDPLTAEQEHGEHVPDNGRGIQLQEESTADGNHNLGFPSPELANRNSDEVTYSAERSEMQIVQNAGEESFSLQNDSNTFVNAISSADSVENTVDNSSNCLNVPAAPAPAEKIPVQENGEIAPATVGDEMRPPETLERESYSEKLAAEVAPVFRENRQVRIEQVEKEITETASEKIREEKIIEEQKELSLPKKTEMEPLQNQDHNRVSDLLQEERIPALQAREIKGGDKMQNNRPHRRKSKWYE